MNLKDIVCDFEYAKKLKELGVEQESLFYIDKDDVVSSMETLFEIGDCELTYNFSAFTSDELLKLLPLHVQLENGFKYFNIEYDYDNEYVIYQNLNEDLSDSKLSNALAKILIWLIENKYITVK